MENFPPGKGEHACGSSSAPLGRCRKGAAPSGRTRLRQFACPGQPVQEKEPPVRANTLTQFACPGQPVQERSRPLGANTLTQFACPGQPVQEKGEDAKSNGETAANFVYCYKIAQNRSVLLEMTGAKC